MTCAGRAKSACDQGNACPGVTAVYRPGPSSDGPETAQDLPVDLPPRQPSTKCRRSITWVLARRSSPGSRNPGESRARPTSTSWVLPRPRRPRARVPLPGSRAAPLRRLPARVTRCLCPVGGLGPIRLLALCAASEGVGFAVALRGVAPLAEPNTASVLVDAPLLYRLALSKRSVTCRDRAILRSGAV